MAKYEIMLVLAPTESETVALNLAKDVFGKEVEKYEVLARTESAYPINKSKNVKYVLLNIDADQKLIYEFTRKSNIIKTIWRSLVINLDSEKGLKPKKKTSKFREYRGNSNKNFFIKRNYDDGENSSTPSTFTKKPINKELKDFKRNPRPFNKENGNENLDVKKSINKTVAKEENN